MILENWQRLSKIHRSTAPQFGFRKDNYLGSLLQPNTFEEDWWTFFSKNRFEAQIDIAEKTIDGMKHAEKRVSTVKKELLNQTIIGRLRLASCMEIYGG